MVTEATHRMIREWLLRERAELGEREARRIEEVRSAFFEGMAAGFDRSWLERPPEDYWLESDARRTLFAGPPIPNDPHMRLRAGRGRPDYSYDPRRDPGRVVGDSFRLDGSRRKGKRRK